MLTVIFLGTSQLYTMMSPEEIIASPLITAATAQVQSSDRMTVPMPW
jgi:hypothetical protein